jgi:hypothetical protein
VDLKNRYIRIIEKYLNVIKKDDVELMYGKGTKIKVRNINPSISNNSITVEVVIILGEVINEEVLDSSLTPYLIQDILELIFPDVITKTIVSWDV